MAIALLFALGLWGAAVALADEPWRAPPSVRGRRNPLPAATATAGAALFAANCAVCHGPLGRGDGLAAAALNPPPRDLTSPAVQSDSDGGLFWKITSGRGAMPAWPWLTERERWSLVWALRALPRKAAATSPQ
ncbi:MAG TPA: cytochrome c [Pseudomonadota bacterium]|nr:cytochrome c [Pseudomonadota bacterium]